MPRASRPFQPRSPQVIAREVKPDLLLYAHLAVLLALIALTLVLLS